MKANANIYLIGFMGTGKTTVGQRVAERLGMRFVDMDDEIVARAGKPIPAIFADDGEPAFRRIECAVAADLSRKTGRVVATGGGVVLNDANMRNFYDSGVVICLSATPDAILDRVEGDTNRPLLAGTREEKKAKMAALLEKRGALYTAIPHQVDTSPLIAEQVADRITAIHRRETGAA